MKSSTKTAVSYNWGDNCQAWQLLNDPKLSVIEEVIPAGSAEQPHYHSKTQQYFYVLAGEAVFELGAVEHNLSAGEGIYVQPKLHHCIRNESDKDLRILVISSPHSHLDRVDL